MSKLLVVCPTRNRCSRAIKMLASFLDKTNSAEIKLLIDKDDPQLETYKLLGTCNIYFPPGHTTTELINLAFQMMPNYEFYSVTNDDFIYRSQNWDISLCNKGKISYCSDLISGGAMPTTSVIDGEIIRAVGWLQMPTLTHLYGDNVWGHIGHSLNILKFFKDIVIEHEHWSNLKAEVDETYKKTSSSEMFRKDYEAYATWKNGRAKDDIESIKRKLGL